MSKKVGFLLFSGANDRAIVTICRYAASLNIPFYIFAIDEKDYIFNTKYRKNVVLTRPTKKLEVAYLKPKILALCQQENLDQIVICQTSEFLNTFLLENRAELEEEKIVIPLVNKSTYSLVTNKGSFTDYCASKNVPIPEYFEDFNSCPVPFVAKPKENVIDGKTLYPILIFTEEHKLEFQKKENPNHYFFQEFIKGQSYYLFYYTDNQRNTVQFSQKNLVQQPQGKSLVFAESSDLHHQEISQVYQDILQSLDFKGIVMIEIIEREGVYYLIEANPRFWGPFRLVAEAKPAFIHAFFKDYVSLEKVSEQEKKTKYLWFGGFMEVLRNKENIKWYINKPKSLGLFLLQNLKYDVYFRTDSIRHFIKEIIKNLK